LFIKDFLNVCSFTILYISDYPFTQNIHVRYFNVFYFSAWAAQLQNAAIKDYNLPIKTCVVTKII